ncbi:hypothetical protein Taro_031552 [Colocasia esculenta]|uniref:Uncharacterized protein n=1 Tax=Colocasia esculenta TaxID=4460 RepID=A0A843VJ34_COLES|nr:hypothetical protein [Colocasia esculenta]
MVRGGRSGRVSTSVGRGSASPSTPVIPATGTASPSTPVVPTTGTASPTPPIASPFPSQSPPAIIQQRMRRGLSYLDANHVGFLGPVDSWKEFPPSVRELLFDMFTRRFVFTRLEDLPRARVVWDSTTQTNLRKSMWEARDKATKTTGSQDPTAWMDYGHVWLRKEYWESLCHRWATGPWQERSQAAKRNRATHPEKNLHTSGYVSYATHNKKLVTSRARACPTFRELFDRTHKRKGTDDYVSESARTIVETYDRTMTNRYAEGTPQPDLDPEAWVDTVGVPRKGRVYGFRDSLDTTVFSSYASSVAPPAYASSSAAPPGSGGEDMRTLIREELHTQFGVMVEQLISAIQGVRPSQHAPQFK